MLLRRVLTLAVPLLLLFPACGGQTLSDDGAGASPWGGAPGTGGGGANEQSGGTLGSGSAFGSGGQTTGVSTGGTASGGAGTGGAGGAQCGAGRYDTDLTDGILTCEIWSDCPKGFRRVLGSFDRDAECIPCPEESYSLFVNATLCLEKTECRFSEDEVTPGSPMTDRTCAPSEVFPALETTSSGAVLAVTPTSVYLSYWGYGYAVAEAVRYSFDGEDSSTFTIAESARDVPDLARIGSDVYAVGWTEDTDASATVYTESAFAKKYDDNGDVDWTHDFNQDTAEHFSYVRVAASDDAVYVVGLVTMKDCTENAAGVVTCSGGNAPPQHLVLRVLDPDGNETISTLLDENTAVVAVSDIAVSSDGHLYVLVQRPYVVPEVCETLPEDDPDYYDLCLTPVDSWEAAVLEFDAAGEPVSEHRFDNLLNHLSADEVGNVYALSWGYSSQPSFYRFASFGDLFEVDYLALEAGESIDTFVGAGSGVLAVGRAEGGPLLLTLDASGEIQARDVLEDVAWPIYGATFADVQQAADGTIFVAGYDGNMFVDTWP